MIDTKGLTDEQICYVLGQLVKDKDKDQLDGLVRIAEEKKLIFYDVVSRGDGWGVYDGAYDETQLDGRVFPSSGHAFMFWLGMGSPDGFCLRSEINLYVKSDEVFSGFEDKIRERFGVEKWSDVTLDDLPKLLVFDK